MSHYLNLTPASWQLWCFALLALALVMAMEADFLEQRIPNVLVGLVMVAGLVLNVAGPANGREGIFGDFPGALGGTQALLGVLVGLALFLPLYLAGAMGAGDVKFLAALGAFTGPLEVVGVALCVAACGGVLALGLTLVRGKSKHAWANMVLIFNGATGAGEADRVQRSAVIWSRSSPAVAVSSAVPCSTTAVTNSVPSFMYEPDFLKPV